MKRPLFYRRLLNQKRTTKKFVFAIGLLLLPVVTGAVIWKASIDDSFLSFIRYRQYGWYRPPDMFSIINLGDTLFQPVWIEQKSEFLKIAWNGDTLDRYPELPASIYRFRIPRQYVFSGYDSSIIHKIQTGSYHEDRFIIPVAQGTSRFIATDRLARQCDTVQLSVVPLNDKLVIRWRKH